MRGSERNRELVDQCTGRGGFFLDREPRYDDRGGYYQQPYRKKKKSFLSDLFDD